MFHLHMPVHYVRVSLQYISYVHIWSILHRGKYTRTITHIIRIALHPSQAPRSLFGSKCAVKYTHIHFLLIMSSWWQWLPSLTHTHMLGLLIAQNIINNLHVISFVSSYLFDKVSSCMASRPVICHTKRKGTGKTSCWCTRH